MRDVVVVDASLALKWVLIEQDSDAAIALLQQWMSGGKKPIAPALFAYEITNILYRQTVTKKLSYDEAARGLAKLFSIGVSLKVSSHEEISTRAMELSHQFSLSAAYDAHYLALAERENCECWTADTRLWNAVKGKLSWTRWFNDFQPM